MNSSIQPEVASSPARMVPQQSAIPSRGSVTLEVGAVLPDASEVERELDAVIRELGDRMVQADKDGDPTGRDILCRRMYAAIASRTPQHQARLTAEAEKRIEEARITNGVCYFSSDAAQELGRLR